ncbi:MAG: hypothetical protein Q7K40_05065 [bacterium]|nr:hypothetical protein [bacterium]
MRIEQAETFVIGEIVWGKNSLVAKKRKGGVEQEFLRCYEEENFKDLAFDQGGQELSLTLALCYLEEGENWREVATKIKENGWSASSLAMWKLYIQERRNAFPGSITLPGTIYRDDNFFEWIPVVQHRPVISFFGHFRGSETEVSMKPSVVLGMTPSETAGLAKSRTVLISKTNVLKPK